MKSISIDTADDDFKAPREYVYEDGVLTLLYVDGVEQNKKVNTDGKFNGTGHFYVDKDGDILFEDVCDETNCASNGKYNPTDIVIEKKDPAKTDFKEQVEEIVDLIEKDIKDDEIKGPKKYEYKDGTLTLVEDENGEVNPPRVVETNLPIKGEGTITVDENGNVIVEELCTDKYCASNTEGDQDIVVDKKDPEKEDFKEKVEDIVDIIKEEIEDDNPKGPKEYEYKDGTLTLVKDENGEVKPPKVIKTDLDLPGEGKITVDENGNVTVETICNKKYCASGTEDPIVGDNDGNNQLVENPINPMIELRGGKTVAVGIGETYEEPGVISKTNRGKPLPYTTVIKKNGVVVNSIDTGSLGSYTITYTNEANRQKASVVRTVEVIDMIPVITMSEPSVNYVKEKEVLINVSAIRPNEVLKFTYEIKKDSISEEIKTVKGRTGTLILDSTGIYEVIVSVIDEKGHKNEISKTYRIDSTGPQITMNPERVELESNEALGYNVLTGVSVTDNVDGTIDNSKITIGGDTLLSLPGTYKVTYTVKDRLGNSTTKTRTFVVSDRTKPEIVITPNNTSKFVKSQNIKIEATDNIKVQSISYVLITNGTRGTSTSIDNGGSITLNSTGNYQIEVTAIDSSNNSKTETSGTYKIDTVVPTLTFENVELKVDEVAGYNLMTGVTASDNSELTPSITFAGGLSAVIGTQIITYTAEDEAGNIGTKQRTFTITEATAPIISFSPIKTTGWVRSVTITISATVKTSDTLTTFNYSVNGGAAQKGSINGNSGTATVTLNNTGTYAISASATGSYGNSKTETSGTYQIDSTPPVVGDIGGNPNEWVRNTYLTSSITDSNSGVTHYKLVKNDSTKPTADEAGWTKWSGTPAESINGRFYVTSNGTYYLWVKDDAGNVSASESVKVEKVDSTVPKLTVRDYSGILGDDVPMSSLYTVEFGPSGGSVCCSINSYCRTNLNTLESGIDGQYYCFATSGAGAKTAKKYYQLTLQQDPTITATVWDEGGTWFFSFTASSKWGLTGVQHRYYGTDSWVTVKDITLDPSTNYSYTGTKWETIYPTAPNNQIRVTNSKGKTYNVNLYNMINN